MDLGELVQPDRVIAGLKVRDKAQLVAELSRRAAAPLGMEPQRIEAALAARERLGSTGLGRGFALPHARLPGLDRFFGMLAVLARPIEFSAIDEQPVDLVFLLLIPQEPGNGHVAALAAISRRMRDGAFVRRLREASGSAALHALLAAGTPG